LIVTTPFYLESGSDIEHDQGEPMNKKATRRKAPADANAEAAKPVPARRKAAAKAKAKAADGKVFDFIGKVESIVVKTGSGGETFQFGLRGRHGLRQTLALGTSDSFALSIMAPIVTAAHATETKIGVRVAPGQGSIPQVIEVASRPKLAKGS
jgi:hypothetical protein